MASVKRVCANIIMKHFIAIDFPHNDNHIHMRVKLLALYIAICIRRGLNLVR